MCASDNRRRGITIIELVLTLAIISIIITTITSIFYTGNKSYSVSQERGFAQQDLRLAVIFSNNQLRLVNMISGTKPVDGNYHKFSVFYDYNIDKTVMESKYFADDDSEIESSKISGDWSSIYIKNSSLGELEIGVTYDETKNNYQLVDSITLENSIDLLEASNSFSYVKGSSNIEFYFQNRIDDPKLYTVSPKNPGGEGGNLNISDFNDSSAVKGAFDKEIIISGGKLPYSRTYTITTNKNNEFKNIVVSELIGNKIKISGIAPDKNGWDLVIEITVNDSNPESNPLVKRFTILSKNK